MKFNQSQLSGFINTKGVSLPLNQLQKTFLPSLAGVALCLSSIFSLNANETRKPGADSANQLSETKRRAAFNFDGDGKADVSVFCPNDRMWYLNRSTAGFTAVDFGLASDKLAPADYDGDGRANIAVYRGGTWHLQNS